jgi:nicotinamidase-related amidase
MNPVSSEDRFPVELESKIPLTLADLLRPGRVALVMWDMQKGLAGRSPAIGRIVPNANALIDAAERRNIPVIWSRHILPPLRLTGGPFLRFLMKKQNVDRPSLLKPTMQQGMDDTAFVDGLAPRLHHIVLEKSQPSLFVDTPLDLRLKTMAIDTLVMTGVATDIGIELTCRHGAALGYYSVVVEDATGSYTSEAHERSLAFLSGWTTPVVTTQTVVEAWAAEKG